MSDNIMQQQFNVIIKEELPYSKSLSDKALKGHAQYDWQYNESGLADQKTSKPAGKSNCLFKILIL